MRSWKVRIVSHRWDRIEEKGSLEWRELFRVWVLVYGEDPYSRRNGKLRRWMKPYQDLSGIGGLLLPSFDVQCPRAVGSN